MATTQRYMHLSPAALDSAIRLLDRGRGEIMEAAGTAGENAQILERIRTLLVEAAGVEP